MLISVGEKVHIIYRTLHQNSNRRHFLGEVKYAEGPICRLTGYVFVYDLKSTTYLKKPELRTTIIDFAESGYIVNIIDQEVVLENVVYKYVRGSGLVAVDGKNFSLGINEYGESG